MFIIVYGVLLVLYYYRAILLSVCEHTANVKHISLRNFFYIINTQSLPAFTIRVWAI